MSIRTYFENIADAIKSVYGTTDTVTPTEMPQAIRNFSSIFQTKTLSSPIGGQTTVEGCLSSLSSDLSEKAIGFPKISEFDTIMFTAGTPWTATRNGWLFGYAPSASSSGLTVLLNDDVVFVQNNEDTSAAMIISFFLPIKSGQTVQLSKSMSTKFYGML